MKNRIKEGISISKTSSNKISDYILKISRCFSYISKTSFRSVRTYIYSIILPIIISIGLYMWNSFFGTNILRTPVVAIFSIIPSITTLFFVSFIIAEWKESVFLKQLVNMKITKLQFILAFYFTAICVGFIGTLVNLFCLWLYDLTLASRSINDVWFKADTNISTWILWSITILLSITFNFNIGMLISGVSKSPYIIQTINIALLIFVLFASDVIIDPNTINDKYAGWFYFCYLVGQKYINWCLFMSVAQMQINSYNLEIIIPSLSSYVFFKYIWVEFFIAFIISYSMFYITYITFKSSYK